MADPQKDSGIFGSLFDLNGDGRTDAAEVALMFMLFDELQREENEPKTQALRTYDIDDFDVDKRVIDLDDLNIEGI